MEILEKAIEVIKATIETEGGGLSVKMKVRYLDVILHSISPVCEIMKPFARRNHVGKILAAPQTSLVNLDHSTILQFFNSKIQGILNYYTFAANRIEIQNLI